MEGNREQIESMVRRYGFNEDEARAAYHLQRAKELFRGLCIGRSGSKTAAVLFRETHVNNHFNALNNLLARRVLSRDYPQGLGGNGEEPAEEGRQDLTFEVGPFAAGESGEQTLTEVTSNATVLSVSYTPEGRLLYWNSERVHLARDVTLSKRRRDLNKDSAVAVDVMVAWLEQGRDKEVIEPGEEFLLPILREGVSTQLEPGDELYWKSTSFADGGTEGDPGGTVKITLRAQG